MDVMKLVNKLEERIKHYEAESQKEENAVLKEFYGNKITEARMCILDICDWAVDEIIGEGDK